MTTQAIKNSGKASTLWGTLLTFGGFMLIGGALTYAYIALQSADAEFKNQKVFYEAKLSALGTQGPAETDDTDDRLRDQARANQREQARLNSANTRLTARIKTLESENAELKVVNEALKGRSNGTRSVRPANTSDPAAELAKPR